MSREEYVFLLRVLEIVIDLIPSKRIIGTDAMIVRKELWKRIEEYGK